MRQYGLVGYPLGHSLSRVYFSEKFAKEGITDADYQLYPLEKLPDLRLWIADRPQLEGLNVTIPYKEAVLQQLDWLEPGAAQIGAVNTIRIKRIHGELWLEGYNTDFVGFEATIRPFLGFRKPSALVFGTGGSAKAVCYALDRMNIAWKQVSRRPGPDQLSYAGITPEIAQSFELWINCTPLGMAPNTARAPRLPYEWLSKKHLAYDLIYNPEETLFLRIAHEAGARTMNGLSMLYAQAESAWTIWQSGKE